ncbi:MAG TPA: hypothetical protein VFX86_02180 [Candidatus Saccharimonadales bacterium]|nr:hypothetical protein [Candidatus Saccharimonadales bacterium]
MKKTLLISLIIGVLLGISQIYLVREIENPKFQKAPEWCKLAFTNDPVCFPGAAINYHRGFPLSVVDNSYERSPSKIEAEYIINFFIFALGIPLVALTGYKIVLQSQQKK